jgi:hypothetical protein
MESDRVGLHLKKPKRLKKLGQLLAARRSARLKEDKTRRKVDLTALVKAQRIETETSAASSSTTATSHPDHYTASGLKPRRPHSGYSTERATYQARKADLLRSDPDAFVVFVGEAMAGPFPDFRSALREGLRRFGPGPLFIKQVLAEEPAAETGAFESCPS